VQGFGLDLFAAPFASFSVNAISENVHEKVTYLCASPKNILPFSANELMLG